MASGTKMSFNAYQSGKYGSVTQTSQKDFEVSQDMHLKMSKKIAQLTKVIYALNTKNDEHELVLQTLRDQHEEEVQKISADSYNKLLVYKNRIDELVGHSETIEILKAKVEEYRQKLDSTEEKFTAFKAEALEIQDKEKETYANRLFDMSHEVLLAKKELEEHMQKFSSWQERILAEHSVTIAELNSKHHKEVEDIRSFQRDQDDTWLNQCAKIEEKFKQQIENLQAEVEALKNDKLTLEEDYVAKLEKAQAFYEKELTALKNSQLEGQSKELDSLRREIDRLKTDSSSNEKELRKQIDRLVRQLAETEDNLEVSKQQLDTLQAELASRDSSSNELSKQVQELKKDLIQKSSSLQNVETELAGSKEHCTNLADELLKKSTILGELEAHNLQKESIIKSLQEELEKLKTRLTRLDAERSSLQSHAQSLSLEQNSQLKNLRQALEDMTVDKETLKEGSDKQIQALKDELVEQEKQLTNGFNQKMEETLRLHAMALKGQKKAAAEELTQTQNKLTEQYQTEINQVVLEKQSLQKDLERLKSDLAAKLASAEQEVIRLEKLVKDSQEGLGSASGELENLKSAAVELRAELEKTRAELRASKSTAAGLQGDLDQLRSLHDGKMLEKDLELQNKLKSLSEELDRKWSETMSLECSHLRQELTAQKEDEKKAALNQLTQLKNEEINATRTDLNVKISHLQKQMEELQTRLDSTKSIRDAEFAKWKFERDEEKERLTREMMQAARDYSDKIATMKEVHDEEMRKARANWEQAKFDLEAELKKCHMEEIHAQLAAHKSAMNQRDQLAGQELQEKLDSLKAQHKQQIEHLEGQLEETKSAEIRHLNEIHQNELSAARMELDRAVEISKQMERDHQVQSEELKTEIGYREQHIKNLQDQLTKVQEQTTKLKQEIDSKLLEIKQVQKQAALQLKLQEDKLKGQNRATVDNLTADHLREQQEMLAQFNNAQSMMKDKISLLQIELEEAIERYKNRESRPEDLELIDSLRCEVSEREIRIKDLIEEKRFYQLELVNRETNFNKVFNATPNVGVLNPFQKPKKKGEKAAFGSGAGITQRLDPLPGSPLHDGQLNPAKPLPPPHFTNKKFVR